MDFLLTGGAACGKSTYAEKLVLGFPKPRFYVAAMRPYGEESFIRIKRHRKMRAEKGFETIEKQTDVDEIELPPHSTVLLECICNLVDNVMFDDQGNMYDVTDRIISEVLTLKSRAENLIVVTNDVGSEYSDYSAGVKAYVQAIGDINIALAQSFENVYELVCGIPVVLKGELR